MNRSLKDDFLVKGRGEHALRHVDLRLTIEQENVHAAVDSLAVSVGIEDIANDLTFSEGIVSDLVVNGAGLVGHSHEELSTRVSVEVLGGVALDPLLVPNFGLLALGVDLCDDFVKVRVGVHVLPEGLAVGGVVTTRVVLLGAVVDERDATCGEREDYGVAELSVVAAVVVEEAGVVVVVDEEAERIDVGEVLFFLLVAALEVAHPLAVAEDVADCVVHKIGRAHV